ncbi:transcriptional regulator, TraR/DksA family [Nitrosovibrio sp. Nv17]|nr:transcriptional regulator, TraR/DksA family [Nitrosovibrio sp. Nv17]
MIRADSRDGLMKSQEASRPAENPEHPVPPGEYMSPAQRAFFRQLLEEERDALLQSARSTLEQMRSTDSEPDPSDRASTEEKFSLEFRVRDRERKLLGKIEEALQRIENGTYGWCAETGEPIGIPRLLARPTATLCIEAQERHELLERGHRP